MKICYHGQQRTVEFSVSNYDGDKVNEVLMNFYFTIQSGTEIPLTYEIYETTSDTSRKLEFSNGKSSLVELGYSPSKITKNFQLRVIWDLNNNSIEYANKTVKCNIKLQAEQVI